MQEAAPKHVLVVEDDADILETLIELLETEGFTTTPASNGQEALDYLNACPDLPQLILLDLMMPDPDGFKLCRMLRKEPEFKQTPIIIVTALNDTDSRIVAIGAGANDYLTKPFRLDELYTSIREQLEEAEL